MQSPNELVDGLLRSFQSGDHVAMAACYHADATFEDIAFQLKGREQIHVMWQGVCSNGIVVEIRDVRQVGDTIVADITDTYRFGKARRKVVNSIRSVFRFRDGLIAAQTDECNPLTWARQAFGGVAGEIIGRVGLLRRLAAKKKMRVYAAQFRQGS